MMHVQRPPLPQALEADLARLEDRRLSERDKTTTQQWAWLTSTGKASLREQLQSMTTGICRCMYCEDGEGTDIEHFFPKRDYPDKMFSWANYLLACSNCNSNQKRNQFPLDENGSPQLIDPSVDAPEEHIVLSPSTGEIVARTERGQFSIAVFGLNRQVCIDGRKVAWTRLLHQLEHYSDHPERRDEIITVISKSPFAGVRNWMRWLIEQGTSDLFRPDDWSRAMEFPEFFIKDAPD